MDYHNRIVVYNDLISLATTNRQLPTAAALIGWLARASPTSFLLGCYSVSVWVCVCVQTQFQDDSWAYDARALVPFFFFILLFIAYFSVC